MAQVSNDAAGISQVITDAGRIVFLRRDGILSTGQIVVTSWVKLAGPCLDLYMTVASNTGKVTLITGSCTATTGVL